MVLPDVSDPRWRELVTGRRRHALQNLATQMLITRLRLRTRKGDEASIAEAVQTAWDFFERNPETTSGDVAEIFGARPEPKAQ